MKSQTKRVARLIQLIANNPGVTLSGLCEILRRDSSTVSERTVAKDILSIKNDFGLLPAKGRLRSGYQLVGMVTLGHSEIDILADALSAFALSLNDPEAEHVVERILTAIARDEQEPADHSTRKRLIGQKVIVHGSDTLRSLEPLIISAIRARLPMSIRYASPRTRGPLTLSVYPLFKVFFERAWYLIVRDISSNDYYPCRLDRISEARVTRGSVNGRFAGDITDARYLISCGWGMTFPKSHKDLKVAEQMDSIVVRFDSSVADYILEGRQRHPLANIQRAKDGSGDVLFSIKLFDPWEFKHWVRTFGASAKFVAPQAIVEQERREAIRVARQYGCDVRRQ